MIHETRDTPSGLKKFPNTLLPTAYGQFRMFVISEHSHEHVVLVKGQVQKASNLLCRIHSECLTSEVFSSLKCDCKEQLNASLQKIAENGTGILIYLRQEGRGIGLLNKVKAYQLQEQGLDTVDANRKLGFPDDLRDYKIVCDILRKLQVFSIRIMTNNPDKLDYLINKGIHVTERVPLLSKPTVFSQNYSETKKTRMGHFMGCAKATASSHSDLLDPFF